MALISSATAAKADIPNGLAPVLGSNVAACEGKARAKPSTRKKKGVDHRNNMQSKRHKLFLIFDF